MSTMNDDLRATGGFVVAHGALERLADVSRLRALVRETCPLDLDPGDVAVVATELANNGIEHGEPPVTYEIRLVQGGIRLDVIDAGPTDEELVERIAGRAPRPARLGIRGRGLAMARALGAHLTVEPVGPGKSITALLVAAPRA